MFFDVHCHLTDPVFAADLATILEDCRSKRIGVVLNGLDFNDNLKVLDLVSRYDHVYACLGMHPTNAFDSRVISQIEQFKGRIIGIGEVGLDFKAGIDERQEASFKQFISLAESLNKPLIVHSRSAESRVVELVRKCSVPVILHAFFAKRRVLEEVKGLDHLFLSIPASVEYDKQLQDSVKLLSVDRVLCETDSPYLYKYGRNTPLNVLKSYEAISSLCGLDLGSTEARIAETFKKTFLKR